MARISSAGEGGIHIEGMREVRKAIKDAESKELEQELKAANKAAAEMVAEEARTRTVPVREGSLKDSISALGSKTKGQVKAGKAKADTKLYAGVIHYGDPNRGIKPQPFLHEALSEKWKEVFARYEEALQRIVDEVSTRD